MMVIKSNSQIRGWRWSQRLEEPGFWSLQVAMRRVEALVFKNWSNFQERLRPSLTLKSLQSSPTIRTEGSVREPDALHIPFEHWSGPFDAKGYRAFVEKYQADFVMCSGWLKFVRGLDPAKTVNIHPGPLPRFGGSGMYGHHVHEAVMAAYHRGEITQSAVTMHFVDDVAYDNGPIIFQMPVLIRPDDDAETLAKRVNEKERAWQSYILNLVVHRYIYLSNGQVIYKSDTPKRLFY